MHSQLLPDCKAGCHNDPRSLLETPDGETLGTLWPLPLLFKNSETTHSRGSPNLFLGTLCAPFNCHPKSLYRHPQPTKEVRLLPCKPAPLQNDPLKETTALGQCADSACALGDRRGKRGEEVFKSLFPTPPPPTSQGRAAPLTSFAQLYPGLLGSRPVGRLSRHLRGM